MPANKKTKNIRGGILIASFLFLVFVPIFSILNAQTIPVGPTQGTVTFQSGVITGCQQSGVEVPCDSFSQLITAVKNITNFAVVNIALPFSVIIIAYAGFIYIKSGDNAGERKKANDMFVKVLWGIFWVLAAWVVVNLIMTTLTSGTGVKQLLSN